MNKIDTFLNRIIEGDCLEVIQGFPDECVDLILSNPDDSILTNEGDRPINLSALWQQYKRIIKPNGAIVLIASSPLVAKLILSNPDWLKYKIVWIKPKATDCVNVEKQPLRKHKDICIYYNKRPECCPQMLPVNANNCKWRKDHETNGDCKCQPSSAADKCRRYPYDIVGYNEDIFDWFYCMTARRGTKSHFFPTQSPVDLGRFIVKTFTLPNQIVLDNASGSGSFLISAIMENRQFIGIEKSRQAFYKKIHPIDFVAISNDRVSRAMQLQKEKFTSG